MIKSTEPPWDAQKLSRPLYYEADTKHLQSTNSKGAWQTTGEKTGEEGDFPCSQQEARHEHTSNPSTWKENTEASQIYIALSQKINKTLKWPAGALKKLSARLIQIHLLTPPSWMLLKASEDNGNGSGTLDTWWKCQLMQSKVLTMVHV